MLLGTFTQGQTYRLTSGATSSRVHEDTSSGQGACGFWGLEQQWQMRKWGARNVDRVGREQPL